MVSIEIDMMASFIDNKRINKTQYRAKGIMDDARNSIEFKYNDGCILGYYREVEPDLLVNDIIDNDLGALDYVFADDELNDELNETGDVVFARYSEI